MQILIIFFLFFPFTITGQQGMDNTGCWYVFYSDYYIDEIHQSGMIIKSGARVDVGVMGVSGESQVVYIGFADQDKGVSKLVIGECYDVEIRTWFGQGKITISDNNGCTIIYLEPATPN